MTRRLEQLALAARSQEGFTMIIAIGVMFVTGLLLVAAFTVANGDVHNTRRDTAEKQAYFAALAGVQQYEHELQVNPDFWQTCKSLESEVPEEKETHYVVKPLPATGQTACSTGSPFTTMIESKGVYANTFRIKSVGTGPYEGIKAPQASKTIIATFGVNNFLDYVFYTNFETVDPGLYAEQPTEAGNRNCENAYCTNETLAKECKGKTYEQWHGKFECPAIEFGTEKIDGPLHTNDTSQVTGATTFGREGQEPPDAIEMNGGTYGSQAGCKSSAKYYTATKCYITTGETLTPPPNDESLEFYVKPEFDFKGVTKIKLEGATMTITNNGVEKKSVAWPENGLVYVQNNGSCGYTFEPENSDNATETSKETNCGNVYVQGSYEKSLTVAGANDVIVTGSLYPTSVAGKLAASGKEATEPTGTSVLGLIASDYVRVYHPCSSQTNQTGYFKDPWIYAGILATSHSWIVDNSSCGAELGNLNVYGAIGQDYRGIVLRGDRNGTHGYVKNYEYDERLATDEPPYFLAPLKAGWKIIRQTASSPG